MKFKRLYEGHYESEDGRFTISKIYDAWHVTDNHQKEELYRCNRLVGYKAKFLGHRYTLREAKELCENV